MDRTKKMLLYLLGGIILIVILLAVFRTIYYQGKTGIQIVSVDPLGEVSPKTNFTIEFSHDMIPPEQVDQTVDSLAVLFKPAIPGRFKWISSRRLRFYPDLPLRPATEYSLEILPEICTLEDTYLEGDRTFNLYTERLKVTQVQMTPLFTDKKMTTFKVEVLIQLNSIVEPDQLKSHFTLHANDKALGNELAFTLETTEPSQNFTVLSEEQTRPKTEQAYSIRIRKDLLPVGGELGLNEDYVKTVSVGQAEPLKLIAIYPTSSGTSNWIVLKFSSEVLADVADNYIEVKPAIPFQIQASHRILNLKGNFQAGNRYTVTIKKGLPARNLAVLDKELTQRVFIENLEPNVSFTDKGFYLPRSGNRLVGIETVNIKAISLEIFKVFANNLVYLLNTENLFDEYYYYESYGTQYLGQEIHSEEIAVLSRLNEPKITPIDLSSYLDASHKGIFRIIVRDTEYRWRSATKWVIATDLGIITHKAEDELFTSVHSLTSLEPISEATVTLFSRNNQVIASANSDLNGLAMVVNLKEKQADFEPFLIVVSKGEDLSFLKFQDCALATADFDVAGRPHLVTGYEAAIYTDRGVYRPGEKVHLVAVVRDRQVAIPADFPVKLEVRTPENRLFQEFQGRVTRGGACEFEIELPNYAQTGQYLAKLMLTEEEELGRLQFSVEEFIPDRIKVTLTTPKDSYRPGETVPLTVVARNLFGPPAAGRKVEATCTLEEQPFSHSKFTSYQFGDPDKSFKKMEIKLGEAKLDTGGRHQFDLKISSPIRPPSSLSGILSATVTEPGGRAVSAYAGIAVHPYPFYIGLRQQTEGYAQLNQPVAFDYVVIDENGEFRQPDKLIANVYKIIWHSILKRDSRGLYRYVSESSETLIQRIELKPVDGKGRFDYKPQDYGQYRVQVQHSASQTSSSLKFYASGWGYAPWSMAHPDRLDIEFDKATYQSGETAKVLVKAPFPGKLLYWIEREGVFDYRSVNMPENTANLEIPVKANYKPNVYFTATLIRSIKSIEKQAPVRAFGTAPLLVNCEQERLNVRIEAVNEMRPLNKLDVEIKVDGPSKAAYLTLAAVDEGICQLTDFKIPDLHGFFYAKKRLQVEPFDMYNFILPELEVAEVTSSSAGDRMAGVRKKHLTPVDAKRVKPVALWAGLTELGTRGSAKISFDIPEFNGSLRLMAVVFDGPNFGNARKNVTVRDLIVLTPTFPRFIAPEDQFKVPVLLMNGTGKAADFTLQLKAEGPIQLVNAAEQKLTVANNQEGQAFFELKALAGMGKINFGLTAKGGGSSTSMTTEIPLRPPAPPVTETGSGSITPDKPVALVLPAKWIPGTESYQLTTSGFPDVQFAGGLKYLLHYPYGCIEQTTSRVLPLLYFKELAQAADPAFFKGNTAEYYIEAGIDRITSLQLNSGGFAYWPGSDEENKWGSIYAAHFLVEARKAGYAVPSRVYAKMMRYLKEEARRSRDEDEYYLEQRAYSLYVLAAAGQADQSSMIYLKNNQLDLMNASSKFLLAGAYGLAGDLRTARELLPVNIQPQSVARETGGNFNSSVRTNAIILNVLAELAPQNPSVPVLVKWLSSQAKAGRWYNTQDNAWAFLAIGKALKGQEKAQFTGQIKLDSQVFSEFTDENKVFTDNKLGGKKLSLSIQGQGTAYYYWQAAGIPRDFNIEEKDNGLTVRRVFLSRDGQPVNYQQIRQGDLVIAEITLNALDKALENVIVADLLPAGLEIENPRLESREDVAWIKDKSLVPDYLDLRDDRLILFVNLPERREQKFYYALRAVTIGEFILPPVKAEAMYDPVYSSVASSGMMRVVAMD